MGPAPEERHLTETRFYVAPSGAGRFLGYRCYKDLAPTEPRWPSYRESAEGAAQHSALIFVRS
jgi:hypothetical protein